MEGHQRFQCSSLPEHFPCIPAVFLSFFWWDAIERSPQVQISEHWRDVSLESNGGLENNLHTQRGGFSGVPTCLLLASRKQPPQGGLEMKEDDFLSI